MFTPVNLKINKTERYNRPSNLILQLLSHISVGHLGISHGICKTSHSQGNNSLGSNHCLCQGGHWAVGGIWDTQT